ncbi:ribonuclease H-like domain-containing protein [Candidatus Woesearchaeota archaeon]|nr:ribonuclease H-like domain-containing protein [Candidatus Woesearchaeota archaeon]
MIRNSFIFLERVDHKIEQNLWAQGIYNWDAFLRRKWVKGLSRPRKLYYNRKILEAKKALYKFNSSYFANMLPSTEIWRLYDFFKEDAVFFDIETTGLSNYADVTMFGLFDGIDTKILVRNISWDLDALKKEFKKYKMIVTYNGTSFDLPFVKKRYPDLIPDNIPHFDLRFACNRIGLTGGLKGVEKALGIKRRKLVDGLDGGDALRLWKMYKATGDEHYINLLVEYNEEDIINLKTIANIVVKKLKEQSIKRNQ